MKKKLLISGILLGIMQFTTIATPCFAGYYEHYSRGQQFYFNSQYSSAIDEFKQALMIRGEDSSSRIGLVNAYLARATFFANSENNFKEASNDFRSALFYLKYYVSNDVAMNSMESISSAINSLKYCEKQYGADNSVQGHFVRAQELDGLGNYSAAIYEYEQVVNNPMYRKMALSRIATMFSVMKNYKKAHDYYKILIEMEPNDIMARFRYANVLDKLGNIKGSSDQYNYVLTNCGDDKELLSDLERIYNKKLMENPKDADLLADLGAIKQRQGKYSEAYELYKQSQAQANRSEATALNTQMNMGTLLQVQGKFAQAIDVYKKILVIDPNNYNANLYLAQCYEGLPECKKQALQQYKKLQNMRPDVAEYKDKVAELTRTAMSPDEVYLYVKSVVSPDKYYIDELYNFALSQHEQKNYDTAIKYYSLIKDVNPTREDVYENLAVCYAQVKDYQKARDTIALGQSRFPNKTAYSKLLKDIDNDCNAGLLAKAYEAYNKGDYKSAIEYYTSISEVSLDIMLGIAGSYQALKDLDKALEYYKQAFQFAPNNSDIAYSIGAIYVNNQNYVEAKTYFQKALTLNPNNNLAKDALLDMKEVISQTNVQDAVYLLDHKQYNDALKLLNKSLAENPSNTDAYYYRANVYDGLGKYNLAIEDYKKSLKLNPEQPVLNYMIAVDYDNMNDFKLAMEYYKRFLKVYDVDDEYSQYVKARIPEIEEELKYAKGSR